MAALALVAAAGAAGIVLMLALKLRGPSGGRDLLCPPGPRKLSREQVQSLAELVGRGEQAIGLVERFAGAKTRE